MHKIYCIYFFPFYHRLDIYVTYCLWLVLFVICLILKPFIHFVDYLSLLCKLPCNRAPHFHCPNCCFTTTRDPLLGTHYTSCIFKHNDDLWNALVKDRSTGVDKILQKIGLKRDSPVPAVDKVLKVGLCCKFFVDFAFDVRLFIVLSFTYLCGS